MGKQDDSDEDEKGAYLENARSSGGGGKGGEDGDDEDEGLLNPVVKAFCHYVVAAKFRKSLDEFFGQHSGEFEDAEADGEQRLEWTEVFESYVRMVEEALETFCGIHALEPSAVFTMVQRATASGMLDDEFLPSVLGVTEYRFFIEQASLTANEDRYHARAQRLGAAAASDGGESKGADDGDAVSGVWRVATKDGKRQLTETGASLDAYLRAVGIPKSLRGVFRGSLFSAKGLILIKEGETLVLVSDTLTGRTKQTFRLDGERRDLANQAGTKTPFTATADAYGRIALRNEKPSGLPRGSAVVHTYQLLGDILKCTAEVEKPGGVVLHEFFYKRAVPKKKSRGASPAKAHK